MFSRIDLPHVRLIWRSPATDWTSESTLGAPLQVGTMVGIWRYPVKSMGGQHLGAGDVRAGVSTATDATWSAT
jgi:hypothetical protein